MSTSDSRWHILPLSRWPINTSPIEICGVGRQPEIHTCMWMSICESGRKQNHSCWKGRNIGNQALPKSLDRQNKGPPLDYWFQDQITPAVIPRSGSWYRWWHHTITSSSVCFSTLHASSAHWHNRERSQVLSQGEYLNIVAYVLHLPESWQETNCI